MREALGITRLETAYNEVGQALKAHLEASASPMAIKGKADASLAVPGLPGLPGGLGSLVAGLDVPKIIQGVLDKLLGGGGGEGQSPIDPDLMNQLVREHTELKHKTNEIAGMLIDNLRAGGTVIKSVEGEIKITRGASIEGQKKD